MARVEVSGAQVWYDAPRGVPAPGGGGPVLFCVHGAGGSSRHFAPMLAEIGEGLFPVAVDMPGHGATGGFVPESLHEATSFLDALLDALGVSSPVVCVGHSLGGLLALGLALRSPGRVRRLVLLATAARLRLHPDFVARATAGAWDGGALRGSFGPDVPEGVQRLVLDDLARMRVRPGGEALARLGAADLRPEVRQIGVPALVVAGDDDVIVSPRHSRSLARDLPDARLRMVPGAGHYLHVERPAVVAREVRLFCGCPGAMSHTVYNPAPGSAGLRSR